jgi:hypothetical protein
VREVLPDEALPPGAAAMPVSDARAGIVAESERRCSLIRQRQWLLSEAEGVLVKLFLQRRVNRPTQPVTRSRGSPYRE